MGISYSPSIVTSGLVMAIDAANTKSYPGSGSTWFDMSGNSNHMTLTGSPTVVNNAMAFDGSTQYATNSLNLSAGTSTIMAASRYTGGINGRVVTSATNNWLLGNWGGSVANYYSEGWVTFAGPSGGLDTNWRIYTGTADVTADLYNLYINGDFNTGNSGGSAGPNGISLGRYPPGNAGAGSEYSACEVSFLFAYTRVLTANEIQQNFNALRRRFSL